MSIDRIADAYLRELALGGNFTTPEVVEHVDRRRTTIEANDETAAEFLDRVRAEFSTLPEPESERTEVELDEPAVMLRLGKTRFFVGFLGTPRRAVWAFDTQQATPFNEDLADEMQLELLGMGFPTERELVAQ